MPEKTPSYVLGFYAGIFHFYDAVNALLTFGLDAYWRRAAARGVLASRPARVLDVCCGTGMLLAELARADAPPASLTGLDLSGPMLSLAAERVPRAALIKSDAADLPYPDASFDALSISFATRNLGGGLAAYFSEFRRVLKPGGVFVHLETSRPAGRLTRALFLAYVKAATAAAGLLFPSGKAAYRFLGASIASFPGPDELTRLLLEAGFSKAEYRRLTFGAAALHTAVK